MSTELEKINLPLPIPLCIDIAYRSMRGDLITVDDIASYANISLQDAISLITNATFNTMSHQLAIANARQGFDAIAFNELIKIARYSNLDKDRVSAIKTLGDLLGLNESKKNVGPKLEVNFNIDQMVRMRDKTPFKGF